jgi:hypothetical protein
MQAPHSPGTAPAPHLNHPHGDLAPRNRLSALLTGATARLLNARTALLAGYTRRRAQLPREAGDVPGWVMVTLMSALLVAGIFAVAGPQLNKLFVDAISKVSGM